MLKTMPDLNKHRFTIENSVDKLVSVYNVVTFVLHHQKELAGEYHDVAHVFECDHCVDALEEFREKSFLIIEEALRAEETRHTN